MKTISFDVSGLSAEGLDAFFERAKLHGAKVALDTFSVFAKLNIPFMKGTYHGRKIFVGALQADSPGDFNGRMIEYQIRLINMDPLLVENGFRMWNLNHSICHHLDLEGQLSVFFPDWVSFDLDRSGYVMYRDSTVVPGTPRHLDRSTFFPKRFYALVCLEPTGE